MECEKHTLCDGCVEEFVDKAILNWKEADRIYKKRVGLWNYFFDSNYTNKVSKIAIEITKQREDG